MICSPENTKSTVFCCKMTRSSLCVMSGQVQGHVCKLVLVRRGECGIGRLVRAHLGQDNELSGSSLFPHTTSFQGEHGTAAQHSTA